ncbi:TQO small subunit DoxD [Flavobacterium sp. MK4S-17]|uniref:TQO small subunit DoxD n=1 Tax=Flavobacterium sp. MK4S-17 TaxID=2543737 RepID=UPI001359F72B|nr:TQO small subunit DoxD [Flavobacterium sp. MK4S-17]
MEKINIKNDAGLLALAIRLVVGWTYFSAFWRRLILENKLDPEAPGYIGEKFNHFLPNALGIKPLIQYMVENPEVLWYNMVIFTVIEGIVGLFIMLGLFTRMMSAGIFLLALGILLGSGWIGTTCLDEWQIGVLGMAAGFVLFLSGSGKYSLDNYLIKNNFRIAKSKWFAYLGSGALPLKENVFPKIVLGGSLLIFFITLLTNQVFHGGLWGELHNKSVKPKLEITNGNITQDMLSFDMFRTEGADVYGSWVIGIELLDESNNTIMEYIQNELASLSKESINNYYIAKIKPGKHSLVVPLGAKATFNLFNDNLVNLPTGDYTLKITDISGAYWEHVIKIN